MKILILIFALTACSTAHVDSPSTTNDVRDASEAQMKECADLGEVTGKSPYGGMAADDVGIQNAKNEVRAKVSQLGGSHVVWIKLDKGLWGSKAIGQAYSCSRSVHP